MCRNMDCFAEPVIGRASRDPLARNDGERTGAALQQPWLFRFDLIADFDRAAGYDLGVHAALVMAEPALQRVRDVEVAYRAFGIDIDRRAADDGLDHLQPDVSNRERPVEQLEFVPCRPARDVQIGAEAQGMNRLADDAFDRG